MTFWKYTSIRTFYIYSIFFPPIVLETERCKVATRIGCHYHAFQLFDEDKKEGEFQYPKQV